MRLTSYLASFAFLSLSGCAGLPLPFTDYRLANFPIEVSRDRTNSSCTTLEALNAVAFQLEARHVGFIRSQNYDDALLATELVSSLGEECQVSFVQLSVAQIKDELFGNLQTITDSSKLRELGGLAFEFEDVSTEGAIELSLHVNEVKQGPRKRMVGVYRLADNRILHFNYSGVDNVDKKSRSWPLDEFFRMAIGAGIKAVVP